jgi:hypothetical protein
MKRWTILVFLACAAVLSFSLPVEDEPEDGELDSEDEDEYYGEDYWGQGNSPNSHGEDEIQVEDGEQQSVEPELEEIKRHDFEMSSGTYITDAAGSVIVKDLGQRFVLSAMRQEGKLGEGFPDVEIKDLNFTLQGSTVILRFDGKGQKVKGATRVSDFVFDIAAAKVGKVYRVVVATEYGVLCLNARATRPLWLKTLQNQPSRVSIGSDGKVAALVGNEVFLIDQNGELMGTKKVKKDWVTDVAIASGEGHPDLVYVSGFAKVQSDIGMVQCAFLYAFDFKLKMQWKNWDWGAAVINKYFSDTRIMRMTVGANGDLYALGQTFGGKSVFRWGAKDINTLGNLFESDKYSMLFEDRDTPVLYVARMKADSGDIITAQTIATVKDDGKGDLNSFETSWGFKSVGDIAVLSDGSVYIAAVASDAIHGRSSKTINGEPIGRYIGPEASLLVLSPDLRTREAWTVFAVEPDPDAEKLHSAPLKLAAAEGAFAITTSVHKGKMFLTKDAMHSEPPFTPCSWLGVGPTLNLDEAPKAK